MKAILKLQNLKCHGCANTIEKKLNSIENISNASVDNNNHTVSLLYKNESDLEIVKKTLQSLGYPEEGELNSFSEKAKSFVSCALGKIN